MELLPESIALALEALRAAAAARSRAGAAQRTGDGRPAGDPLAGHYSAGAVGLQPGRPLHRGGGDGPIVPVWDVVSGRELAHLNHDDRVVALSFGPDSRFVATASLDHTARLWDSVSGSRDAPARPRRRCRLPPELQPGRTASSRLRVARPTAGAQRPHLGPADAAGARTHAHPSLVYAIAFSPDGRFLATASEDRTARLWDAASGQEMQRLVHDDPPSPAT